MLRFKIQNIYSKSPKILLINNNFNIIGNSTYSIINSSEASINNIYIKSEYRNYNNGSALLQYTENVLKKRHKIEKSTLLAYEPVNCNLRNFFQKNGYRISNTNFETYDDGVSLFHLIPMYKFLNE